MTKQNGKRSHTSQPDIYQIRIEGHLDDQWTDWFEGLAISLEENGDTFLTGPVIDQAALFGLLKKVRDLGMPLISLDRIEPTRVNLENPQDAELTDKRNEEK